MRQSVPIAKRAPIGMRSFGLAVAASVGALLLVAGAASAEQFAGERFAPVASTAETAALDVRAITVVDGTPTGLTFTVTFSGPFASPSDGYRVGISVGDPTGKRTRWSAVVNGGQVAGTVETGDGVRWDADGATTATLDAEAGRATIDAQPTEVVPGSALWVEVELPTPLGSFVSSSTYFSYDALVQPQTTPMIAGTAWGSTRDSDGIRVEGAVRVPGTPPTAAIVNRALVMSSLEAPPTLLSGQPVTAATDSVRFFDATAPTPGDGGYVAVDRLTGSVQLFRVQGGAPSEIEGAADTIAPSAAPGASSSTDPPGTRTVSIDLAAVEQQLGLPADASNVALAVDRDLTLGNGSVVTASGVAATVALLEAAGPQPQVVADPADDVVEVAEGSDVTSTVVAAIVGVVALLVIGAVVVAVLLARRRRSRHRSLLDEGWLDRGLANQATAPPASSSVVPVAPVVAAAPSSGRPAAGSVPEPESEVVLDLNEQAEPAMADVPDGNGHGNGHASGVEAGAEATEADARASQVRALEELEAQFADLVQRVDRLGGDHESR
jgi:hypothetical protein